MPPSGSASLLRTINRSAVLEFVRKNSPVSRTEIANQINVSLPTVMRIVDDLIDERLVRETGLKNANSWSPALLTRI